MIEPTFSTNYTLDNYAPMEVWWKDHWSVLGYISTVMTEVGGFQVGFDPRMSQNRHSYRVMSEECAKPKRPNPATSGLMGAPVMEERYSTRIKEGEDLVAIRGHDDHCSVQDLAAAGLFTIDADDVQPGVTLKFSDKGFAVSSALMRHKQEGNNFASFVYMELA